MYVAGSNSIVQANPDGTGAVDLGNPGNFLTAGQRIALDSDAGKLYITDYDTYNIIRVNVDGTGAENLGNIGGLLNRPAGIALDPAAGKMYVANWTSDSLIWANLDGTGAETVVANIPTAASAADFANTYGMAIDVDAGKLYFASSNGNAIVRGNTDGTGFEELANPGGFVYRAYGVALDTAAGKMYITSYYGNNIVKANLDGTGAENLGNLGEGLTYPKGIAVDPIGGKIYVTSTTNNLYRANLDGTGGEYLGNAGGLLTGTSGLVLDISYHSVPALNEWGMLILAVILVMLAIWFIRTKRNRSHGTA